MASKSDPKNEARLKREAAQAAVAAKEKRTRNLQILAAIVFVALLIPVGIVLFGGGKDTPDAGIGADDTAEVQGVAETKTLLAGLEQNSLALGDPKAPITIIEFIDVQCPFCRDHQLDEQPTIIKELVRTGKAKLRLAPIALGFMGEDSEAGRVVMMRLAAQDKGWNYANLFFFNQGDEQTGYVTDDFLQKLAVASGGTAADAAPRTADGEIATKLDEIDQLSEDLGVTGTPTFAIGKTGTDPKDYELIEITGAGSVAEQVIAKAEALATKEGV